jgi:hypothetical protein
MDYIKAILQWTFLFVANVILDLIGLVVVAIAIPFRVDGKSLSDGRPIKNLPKCVWLFGNDYDGLLGDKRMWWAANTPFGLPADHFISMYTWAALRNPVNNMRLTNMFSCPVEGSTITYKGDKRVRDKAGEQGWQFVTTENNGKKWYGFYLVHLWSDKRAFVIRLGYKTEPSDAGSTERQGMTTKINLYKSI